MLFLKKTIKRLLVSVCILYFTSFCNPKVEWIRELPPSSVNLPDSNNLKLKPGNYLRPSEKKSPMGSNSYEYEWTELIHITKENRFFKEYREKKKSPDETKFKIITGKGNYKQRGAWVLLETESIQKVECSLKAESKSETIDWKKSNPCGDSKEIKSTISHSLLYHFKSEDGSLAPMQYESGYTESSFGIVWESKEPYAEDLLFKKARDKFTKKEFQPHVYYYGRLD
ncbi:hypothetical protein [Leptospira sp. 'Mane']|uniref:hypothetical protein n=1 Tax=Leptospira sp. 'Mane' TaxID=3387407 RepID=UPI00398B8DC6